MNLEHAPWLFTPALFYVFIIVALLSVEIVKKTLIPHKWKIRTALLGILPLFIALIIAVFSMAGEMLYLLPEYVTGQQIIRQLVDTAYGYNNNLLIMIPMGLFYIIVLSISHNKNQLNTAGVSSQTSESRSASLRQGEMDLDQEREKLKRKDDEWREACEFEVNYWNDWANP